MKYLYDATEARNLDGTWVNMRVYSAQVLDSVPAALARNLRFQRNCML